MAVLTSAEHQVVAELCRAPRSVVEVAALLSLPLDVAGVLLADMAESVWFRCTAARTAPPTRRIWP